MVTKLAVQFNVIHILYIIVHWQWHFTDIYTQEQDGRNKIPVYGLLCVEQGHTEQGINT